MRTAYSYASLIRSMEPEAFPSTDPLFSDVILRGWATDYADPEIDARLGAGFGVPFPVSTFTDLASATPWTTITTTDGAFDTDTDVDLILVLLSGTNFDAGEYRISAVASSLSMTVTTAAGSGGASSSGVAWIANAPALIRRISAILAAAHGLDANIGASTVATVGRAEDLRKRAFDMLDDLVKGKLSIPGYPTGTYSGNVVQSQDPETRPDTQVFAGRPEDYRELVETREG